MIAIVAVGFLLGIGGGAVWLWSGGGAGDDATIAVVGCVERRLSSADGVVPGDSTPPLQAGTPLTVLQETDHRLHVRTNDGRTGWLPRSAVCTLAEWKRRSAADQVPKLVGEVVHENGALFLRGQFRIRNGNWSFEKGQAYWLGPTMVGQELTLNGTRVTGDPYVLYVADANNQCVALPVWGHRGPLPAIAATGANALNPISKLDGGLPVDDTDTPEAAAAAQARVAEDLRKIAALYLDYLQKTGAPPRDSRELSEWAPDRGADPAYHKFHPGGEFVVIWNVNVTAQRDVRPARAIVLAYERNAPVAGGAVALGDGTVVRMTVDELSNKLDPKGEDR